jgi:septal ring factor EnvC (AmiA/AmiB activator)
MKELSQKKVHLVKESGRLEKLTKAFDKKENTLRKELVVKNKILTGIKRSQLFVEQKLEDLKRRTQNLGISDEGVLDAITRPNFANQQGSLPSPVNGKVVRQFGPYHADDRQITLNSKGVFLETQSGSAVKAVFAGVVSYVGSLPGLDQILVLDHGDHYFTVYGQLTDVKVKPGDAISQSQIIARSGHEKFKNLNGVYFEIRHFSEPYNPTEWVRGLTL